MSPRTNLPSSMSVMRPTVADITASAEPLTPRLAALLAPVRTVPRTGDHGFEGVTEIWTPGAISQSDIPHLRRQMDMIESAMRPGDGGAILARIFALLSHYRQSDLPPDVEAAVAADWIDDLGEYPLAVVEEACRRWRRDQAKYRFKPHPGDIRKICSELTERITVMAERIRCLLKSTPSESRPQEIIAAARAQDIRSRVVALAHAKRMP